MLMTMLMSKPVKAYCGVKLTTTALKADWVKLLIPWANSQV